MNNLVVLSLILLIPPINALESPRLNVPHVLLPSSQSTAISFDIYVVNAEGHCYDWSLSRPNVVKIERTELTKCSCSIRITTLTHSTLSASTLVIARDTDSLLTFTCHVTVSQINSISIVSTTKELEVSGIPEIFEVQGFDATGNIFSTLSGLEFAWSFSPPTILTLVKYQKSLHALPDDIELPDGKYGYAVLVGGREVGVSSISAKLVNPLNEEAVEASTHVIVINRFVLIPSDNVYVLRGGRVDLALSVVSHSLLKEVVFPSERYRFVHSSPSTACQIDHNRVTGVEIGVCRIVLTDLHVRSSQNLPIDDHMPALNIFVVDPALLVFHIDRSSWNLLVGSAYDISLQIMDAARNPIHPSHNIVVTAAFPPSHFRVINSTQNGLLHTVVVLHDGFVRLEAAFTGVRQVVHERITTSQDVGLFHPLRVTPDKLVIGFHKECVIDIPIHVSGGSGSLSWIVSPENVLHFSPHTASVVGVVSPGVADITVGDSNVDDNVAVAETLVVPVGAVEFAEGPREAFLGELLLVGGRLLGYSDSRTVQIEHFCLSVDNFAVEDQSVFTVEWAECCFQVGLRAVGQGITKLVVTVGKVTHSVTIASYNHIQISPDPTVLLSPDSSFELSITGGPFPWYDRPGMFSAEVQFPQIRQSLQRAPNSSWSLSVACAEVGSQVVSIALSNAPSKDLPQPLNDTFTFTYDCEEPVDVVAVATTGARCRNRPIFITTGDSALMRIVAITRTGRVFHNYSIYSSTTEVTPDSGVHIRHGPNPRMFEIVGDSPGDGHFRVVSYLNKMYDTGVSVRVVEELKLSRNDISIHMDFGKEVVVGHSGGSGVFSILSSNKTVALLNYHGNLFTLSLQSEGVVTFDIADDCLGVSRRLEVFVGGIERILLSADSQVELGTVGSARAILYNKYGKMVTVPPLGDGVMRWIVGVGDVLGVGAPEGSEEGVVLFDVRGGLVGSSTIQLVYDNVQSNVVSIEVYPPLLVNPNYTTLIVGSHLQITTRGGPTSPGGITYLSADSSIADVHPRGLVTARSVGITTVHVIWVPAEGHPEKRESQHRIVVNVTSLSCLSVHAHSSLLYVGNKIRLFVTGCESGVTPFAFLPSSSALTFQWYVGDQPLVKCQPHYKCQRLFSHDFSSSVEGEFSFRVRVTSSLVGQLTAGGILTAPFYIKVTRPFSLIYPQLCTQSLLMSPMSSVRLVTSRQGWAVTAGNILTVKDGDWLVSGDEIGREFVTLQENSSGETFGFDVRVSLPHHMMASNHSVSLTTGDSFTLDLSYYGVYGEVFEAVNSSVSFRMSRYDLMSLRMVGDRVLEGEVWRMGFVLLEIRDRRGMIDYIGITVGERTGRRSSYVLGEVLCLPFSFVDSNVLTALTKDVYVVTNAAERGYLSYEGEGDTLFHDEFDVYHPTVSLVSPGERVVSESDPLRTIQFMVTLNASLSHDSCDAAGAELVRHVSCHVELPSHVSSFSRNFMSQLKFSLDDWNYYCYVTVLGHIDNSGMTEFQFRVVASVNGVYGDSSDVIFLKEPRLRSTAITVGTDGPTRVEVRAPNIVLANLKFDVSNPLLSVRLTKVDSEIALLLIESAEESAGDVNEIYLSSDVIKWKETLTVTVAAQSKFVSFAVLLLTLVVVAVFVVVFILLFKRDLKSNDFFYPRWGNAEVSVASIKSDSSFELRNRSNHLWSVRSD